MAAELLLSLLKPFAHVALLHRVVFPKETSAIPQLRLQYGQIVNASTASERIGQGQLTYCEDVRIWESARLAICASDPSRPVFNPFTGASTGATAPDGRLGFYYLDTQQITLVEIKNVEGWPAGKPFHPLGMGILEITPGLEAILAVVNYAQKSASIEILRITISPSAIAVHHNGTIEHPDITSPNAVVPLSPTNILFTESFGFSPRSRPILHKLEQTLAYPGGSVKALSIGASGNVSCKTLASSISLANGLALNEDRTIIAVAGCTSLNVHLYDVSGAKVIITDSSQITYRSTIAVGFLPDNLSFTPRTADGQEDLIVAGHPSALAYLNTAKTNGKRMSGSKVAKIQVNDKQQALPTQSLGERASAMFTSVGEEVTTLFESKGDLYGTASTANIYEGRDGKQYMLVNGLWEDGLLRVPL